jgi:hypothetical protein
VDTVFRRPVGQRFLHDVAAQVVGVLRDVAHGFVLPSRWHLASVGCVLFVLCYQ